MKLPSRLTMSLLRILRDTGGRDARQPGDRRCHAAQGREAYVTMPSVDDAPWPSGQVCPMLAVDIAESTRADRDVEAQRYLRLSIYGILREALAGAGMPLEQAWHEDRGDGVLVIFPPDLAAQPIIDSFPERLQCLIRRHNCFSCPPARMQLRVAANVGPVYRDENGWAGDDVTLLCRMLEAQPLRRALSESSAELAFIISDYVYTKLVLRRRSLANGSSFRAVRTRVKRTPVHAWIYLPAEPLPQGLARRAACSPGEVGHRDSRCLKVHDLPIDAGSVDWP